MQPLRGEGEGKNLQTFWLCPNSANSLQVQVHFVRSFTGNDLYCKKSCKATRSSQSTLRAANWVGFLSGASGAVAKRQATIYAAKCLPFVRQEWACSSSWPVPGASNHRLLHCFYNLKYLIAFRRAELQQKTLQSCFALAVHLLCCQRIAMLRVSMGYEVLEDFCQGGGLDLEREIKREIK